MTTEAKPTRRIKVEQPQTYRRTLGPNGNGRSVSLATLMDPTVLKMLPTFHSAIGTGLLQSDAVFRSGVNASGGGDSGKAGKILLFVMIGIAALVAIVGYMQYSSNNRIAKELDALIQLQSSQVVGGVLPSAAPTVVVKK